MFSGTQSKRFLSRRQVSLRQKIVHRVVASITLTLLRLYICAGENNSCTAPLHLDTIQKNPRHGFPSKTKKKTTGPIFAKFFLWPEKRILQGGSSAIDATSRHSIKMIKSSCTRHGAIIPGQRNAHRRAARH